MRRIDDRRSVVLCSRPGITVEGAMRVSGFDATVDGRGVRFERRQPESLVVRRDGDMKVMRLPRGDGADRWIAAIAIPIAAIAVTRLLKRSGERNG